MSPARDAANGADSPNDAARSEATASAEPAATGPQPPSRTATLLWLALVVVALAGIVSARALYSGEAEVAASTTALKAGDPHEATIRARRAAGWYVPGAPHVRVAYERLVALAEAAERNRRIDIALLAWRGVRSASLQTRWLITPFAREAARAEREIARLSSIEPGSALPDPQLTREHFAKLAQRPGPSRLWAAVLMGSFGLALVGLFLWTRAVAGAAGKLHWRKARGPALLSAAAALLWLLSVWRA